MKSRKIPTLVLIVLLCLVFLTTSIGSGQIDGSPRIHSTGIIFVHSADYSYTISKDGIYTVLSDSGGEITRNTDAITIINQAITLANTISGSVLIMDGDYSLTDNIDMRSNIMVYVQLNVRLTVTTWSPTSIQGIVDFRGVTNAHFLTETAPSDESAYPEVIGRGTSNNEFGVLMTVLSSTRTTHCSVGKIKFSNIGGYGICLRGADNNEINGAYLYGYCMAGGGNHHGLTIRAGSYNKLIDCHVDGLLRRVEGHPLFFGAEGAVTYNEVIGGVYENCGDSHAIYWCAETGKPVDHNKAIGGLSRGCRGSSYSCGFKLNPATNSYIDWKIVDCSSGIEMGDGGAGGNHDNVIYAKIINCRRASEFWTQRASSHVENNEIHMDVDGNDPTEQGYGTSENGRFGFAFSGWDSGGVNSYVQNNIIYLKVRNCKWGVVFTPYNIPQSETQEARYNTFFLDVDVTDYAIYWMSGSGGYGRYNTFNGYWHSILAGNCGSIPNADYVYTEAGTAVVATNTFNPG